MLEELQKLSWIIPPAILTGVIIYIVKLFGKIINDFEPYSDDRKYASEFHGFTFFVSQIIYPSFFAVLTYIIISKYTNIHSLTWWPIIITFTIGTFYQIKFVGLIIKFFKQGDKIQKINESLNFISLTSPKIAKIFGKLLGEPTRKSLT